MPEGEWGVGLGFFGQGVGGMVGGDAIQDALVQPLPKLGEGSRIPQRRVHLGQDPMRA
jgi:hypothetical protein